MQAEVLRVANDTGLWFIAVSIVMVVLFQAVVYIRHSFRVAGQIGFEREKCIKGLRAGMISAIGPSVAVFIVMVGMMSVVGAPITWLRLSIIGAAHTELTAASFGAQALGVEFGSPEYDIVALSNSFWTMAINGTGWLLFCVLATSHLDKIRNKMGGGDPHWIGLMSGAAMLGCFSYMNVNTAASTIKGVRALAEAGKAVTMGSYAPIFAAVGGFLGMILMIELAKKQAWLKEYALGIALLIGLASAILLS